MQDELRKRCLKYIEECGVKSRFICHLINIDEAYFCRWRKKQRILNDDYFKALEEFLIEKGY